MPLVFYAVTVLNVLVAAGFSVVSLVNMRLIAPGEPDEAARIMALYAAARTLPLAALTIAALVAGQHDAIIWLATLAGVVQLVDGYVGMQQRDPARTWGPIALGVAQFAVLALVQFTS
jgi:hypothetical protein